MEYAGMQWTVSREPSTPTRDGGLWFRSGRTKRFLPMEGSAIPSEAELRSLTLVDFIFYWSLSRPR
jgi:hypothetical protein